jgi:hypothetical protein
MRREIANLEGIVAEKEEEDEREDGRGGKGR